MAAIAVFLAFRIAVIHIGVLLAVAGSAKIVNPAALSATLARDRLVPGRLRVIVATCLGPTELIVGLWLLTGIFVIEASLLAAVMFITFLCYQAVGIAAGHLEGSCGCYGTWHPTDTNRLAASIGTFVNAAIAGFAAQYALVHHPGAWFPGIGVAAGLMLVLAYTWRRRENSAAFSN